MKNAYHRDVIDILLPLGREGLRLCKIARRVYNLHADLFAADVRYDAIRRELTSYLWKQARRRESPFQRASFGVYALKPESATQLDLFLDTRPAPEEHDDRPDATRRPDNRQLELFK